MTEKTCETSTKNEDSGSGQSESDTTGCRAFRSLKAWQVRQYRIAVDENKWYMGERRGRDVDWKEAEHDFLHNGYYGCAPKWRNEYCTKLCSHFPTCALGQKFIHGQ